VFISAEVAEKLLPKFSRRAEERQQRIKPVDMGTIEQLRQLVELVGTGEVKEIFYLHSVPCGGIFMWSLSKVSENIINYQDKVPLACYILVNVREALNSSPSE
jgi:hypothetical protein